MIYVYVYQHKGKEIIILLRYFKLHRKKTTPIFNNVFINIITIFSLLCVI